MPVARWDPDVRGYTPLIHHESNLTLEAMLSWFVKSLVTTLVIQGTKLGSRREKRTQFHLLIHAALPEIGKPDLFCVVIVEEVLANTIILQFRQLLELNVLFLKGFVVEELVPGHWSIATAIVKNVNDEFLRSRGLAFPVAFIELLDFIF